MNASARGRSLALGMATMTKIEDEKIASSVTPIERPDPGVVDTLRRVGTAKLSSVIARMGDRAIRNVYMVGPVAQRRGTSMAGPALTLQFMPKREDIVGNGEYGRAEAQVHRKVLDQVQPGDVVVVDARGDLRSSVFGEMMLCYFKGRGGVGMVIDGCLRDGPDVLNLDVGLWIKGFSPNFHTQTDIMPHAVNVPIACGGVFVVPGDIIVADDDGAISIPAALAEELAEKGSVWQEWTAFSRQRLLEGGNLQRYYPLSDDARPEYEAWKAEQKSS